MALPTRQDQRRVLTASASQLRGRDETAYSKRLTMPWQYRALAQFDLVGELHFACHFIARQISRCRFYAARRNDDGTTTPIKSGPPVDLMNRIQDPGGGTSQLQYDYGRLAFITGEGVLFGYDLDLDVSRWKFLWKDEVKRRPDGAWVRLNFQQQETGEVGIAYRFWTPHPRWSDLADSPLQAVADVAEELIILTRSVRATAVSRMTNGILALAQELSPDSAQPLGDEDPLNNPFLEAYVKHVTNQIENPGSAEAAVPFLLEGPLEALSQSGVQWIKTHDPATDYMEKDLRAEAINRLALSLDMPPEALTGLGGVNHWGAKAVQLDMWRAHGVNKADQWAEGLASAYLRPSLKDDEYADWQRVVVAYDDSAVVISPDQSADADQALDRVAITREGYRQLKGIPQSMAPDKAEEEFLTALRMRNPDLFAQVLDLEGTPQRGPLPQNGNKPDAMNPPAAPTQGRFGSREEALRASAEILGAAKMALRRCREMAGTRLRSHQHKCAECTEVPGPNALVASQLGPEMVTTLGIKDPLTLVAGGTDGFYDLLCEHVSGAQATALAQMVEVYAAKTLFDGAPQLPAGFVAAVEQAQEVSLVNA